MTAPHYTDESVTLYHGDCLDIIRVLPDASVDAVVTDPPYGLEFMGKEWDAPWKGSGAVVHNPATERGGFQDGNGGNPYSRSRIEYGRGNGGQSVAFQAWCQQWAAECLRVLRPGGHLLAFGGTRTWHRLTCAIEDAGFEIRDSIAWLYGSGFPKSLDVSKAIDKTRRRDYVVAAIDLGLEVPGNNLHDWTKADHSPGDAWWARFKDHLSSEDWLRLERAVVGTGTSGATAGMQSLGPSGIKGGLYDITAPATPAAEQWQGWGTALKPAHEPLVVARKPLVASDMLAEIGSHLDRLESEWQALAAGPLTRTGAVGGSSAPTVTSLSESMGATDSNTVSSWRACWAELCSALSTSTTGTTSSTTTDLRTLSSCLDRLTAESIRASESNRPGLTSIASAADHLFASVVCGLRATLALSVAEPATEGMPHVPQGAAESGSAFEPIVVARKPLAGPVAANILAHGTGALNIDGCRIGHASAADLAISQAKNPGRSDSVTSGVYGAGRPQQSVNTAGRWPTNVVLDGHVAAELDRQSGTLTTNPGIYRRQREESEGERSSYRVDPSAGHVTSVGDSGGASRFFPVFRHEAKAPTFERPRDGEAAHPTVKPLDLMRWLVRLVTPPGGTVLEPFAGSGTTAEACVIEGFRCIAVEREAAYLPLIVARLSKPIALDLFGGIA